MEVDGASIFYLDSGGSGVPVVFLHATTGSVETWEKQIPANSVGGLEDKELLDLGRRIRPPQFDALPPDVRELGPLFRAADVAGTERWLQFEKHSRPQGPKPPAQPLKSHLTFAAIAKITLPALFLTGGADLYAPPPLQQLFAAHVKNSESVVLPNVGHSGYWEQPEAFNKAVLEFVRKH